MMIGLDATIAGIREARAEREGRRDDLLLQAMALKGEIRQLELAERALTGNSVRNGSARRSGPSSGSSIEAVEAFMREVNTATQAQVVAALHRPKNTAKHALKVLTERGVIAPTGALVDRSPEYAMVDGGS
jgi:hypothetical protein